MKTKVSKAGHAIGIYISRKLAHVRKLLSFLYSNLCKLIMNLKDARSQMTIVYLGYLSDVVLTVALGLGLYTEWQNTQNSTILLISMLGLFVFVISCAFQYYFNLESLGRALMHIWLGCILGVIVFTDPKDYKYETLEEVMNILLLTSAVCGWFWSVCERILHLKKYTAEMFTTPQCLESLGLIIASLVTGLDSLAISLYIVAFSFNLSAVRLKSLLGLCSLGVFFIILTFVSLKDLEININVYGLLCFAARHAFEPVIDLSFSNLSTLERWHAFFSKPNFARKLTVLFIFLLNLASAAVIGRLSANHKEWFVVVPIYVILVILWLCFHVIYLISMLNLMSKVTECNLTFNSMSDERRSMNRIMASKGIRHFSLISQRLICLTLLTTILLLGVGWETKTSYSIGLLLIIIPLEAGTLSLFYELGDNLGGTCIGYALIAPHTGHRQGGGVKLLSATAIQEMSSRATLTLNKVQQFFNFNMIENYGCDFSSSGIGEDYLASKVKQFFDRKTPDGPRYDTYLLYYCGDCNDTGDWALSGSGTLKLATLLDWWSCKNVNLGSRLILVLDTEQSWRWVQEVARVDGEYVAIQTCRYQVNTDPEFGDKSNIGMFTDDWVTYNLSEDVDPPWSDKKRAVRAVYKVSKDWTDFTFHLPTPEDIEEHWDGNFPKVTKPLIKGVNFFGTGDVCCCLDVVRKCVKRHRMKWLPPKSTDTGHGYKLVRS